MPVAPWLRTLHSPHMTKPSTLLSSERTHGRCKEWKDKASMYVCVCETEREREREMGVIMSLRRNH